MEIRGKPARMACRGDQDPAVLPGGEDRGGHAAATASAWGERRAAPIPPDAVDRTPAAMSCGFATRRPMMKRGEADERSKTGKLERAGWKLGTPKEFLGLTDEEAALIEIKFALARGIKERRLSLRLTQADLAKQLRSSQSRIAKMEASDATVSMDFLVRSLLLLGATTQEVGRVIARSSAVPAA